VTRSSTLCDVEDRPRRRLLLLPALCLFRRLLCRCLRLSLLRHCCPPSLSGWRHRCSAVANRSALPSDYYSGKKITVTPLNFVCKCRAPPLRRRRDLIAERRSRGKDLSALDFGRLFVRGAEAPMSYGFLRPPIFRFCRDRAHVARLLRAFSRLQRRRYGGIHHAKKILRRTALSRRWRPRRGKKRANRCPTDSRAAPLAAARSAARRPSEDDSRVRFACARPRRLWRERSGAAEPPRSDAELGLEEIVDRLRVGLAAGRFHHLADEPADRFRVRLRVGDLVRVLGKDVGDELFEFPRVAYLL
jgi:hypothetical protein